MKSEKKYRSAFSKNLVKFRKERGLSQQELANRTGISQRMIVYYENKAVRPPIERIEILAKELHIQISDLIGKNEETTDIQNELAQIDARTLKKIKMLLSLPKSQRHIIYTMIESFLKQNEEK
jgi:transcriptional regulator with XRE-family HTH domain